MEMEKELKTVIVNETKFDLVIKQCTRHGMIPIKQVKSGSQHALRHCLSWTFQDYVVETKHATQEICLEVSINSDICCDHERIIVKDSVDGELIVDKEARKKSSPQRWSICNFMLSCLESKHDATEDRSKPSINSDDCCGFEKIYRPLKEVVHNATQKPSRLCREDVGFGYGYHQLIPFFVDGSRCCVEAFGNLLNKRSK